MTVYNLYIYDKKGTLLYYHEWRRTKFSGIPKEEEEKLLYGCLYSLKSFTSKISPLDVTDGLTSFRTNKYKLHYFETATGLKFVINTDIFALNVHSTLQQLYSQVYVEYVVKNPLCEQGKPIRSLLFAEQVDNFIKQSPIFGK